MKKRFKVVLMLLLVLTLMLPVSAYAAVNGTITSSTETNVDKVLSYANQLRNANNAASSTGGFSWDTEGKSYSWTYYNGLMMDALLEIGGSQNTNFANSFYNANINSDGTIVNIQAGKTKSGYLDSCEPMRAVFDLLGTSNASKYKNAIQKYYSYLEQQISYSSAGGNFAHKQDNTSTVSSSWQSYPIGLDGMYMAQPFLMECANAIDAGTITLRASNGSTVSSSSIYSAVYNRLVWVYNNLRNSGTGLMDHGYSVSSGRTNGVTWSRGEGWYLMALVDVIDMMPAGSNRSTLISELPTLFDGLLSYQDAATGMWYNVTAYNSSLSSNKLETSGTSMFAYAMIKAYQNGWVSDSRYYDAAIKAFNGIVANKMTGNNGNYSVIDTYKSSGVNTSASSYTTSSYTTNEAKGVGALIMLAELLDRADVYDAPAETTAPETTAPETTAPETAAPETSAPAATTETRVVWKLADSVTAGKQYLIASGNNGSVKVMGHNNWTVLRADAQVSDSVLTSAFAGGSDISGEDYFVWTFDSSTSGKIHNDKTSKGRYIELWGTSSSNNIVGDYGPNINVTNLGSGAYRLSYGSNYVGSNLTAPPVGSPQTIYLYEKTTITVTVPVETTAPETTVPETTEPETTVPETTVPETTEPETTVPETTVPETTVPETAVPESTVPETTVPETTVPETTEPATTVPETTEPESTVPETTEPETTVPETTEPETTVPETTVPEITEPETTEPETTAPAMVPETREVWQLANTVKAGKQYLIASGNNGSVKVMGHNNWTVLRADAAVTDGVLTSNFDSGSGISGEDYFAWTFDSSTSGKIHNDKTSKGCYIELWGTSGSNNIVGDYGPNINVTNLGSGAYRLSYGSNYVGSNLSAPPVGSPQTIYLYEKTTITVMVPAGETTAPTQPETEIVTTTEEVWQLATSITAGKSYLIVSGNSGSVSAIGNSNGSATKITATAANGRLTLPGGTDESRFLWKFASATSGKISNNGLYVKISSTAQFNTSGETLAITNLGSGAYRISKKTSNGKVYYLNPTKTSGTTNTETTLYLYEKVTITTTVEVPVNR